ncbi:MAG: ATP-dependent 6-phosphofructokinase [Treponema bryantii]|nr:ATP-dependent 6-phosphofructokinase [Treponema bryantii]
MKTSIKTIGILTSGGDAPGLNATIRALCISAKENYGIKLVGIRNGYKGLIENDTFSLDNYDFSSLLASGGTFLGTSRVKPFKNPEKDPKTGLLPIEAIKETFKKNKLDALVCLGGNGTNSTASMLAKEGFNVIGLPKTIDNDIAETEITFGFHTAIDVATQGIDFNKTTAKSHGRVMCVEIMGHKAGWLALYAGIAAAADVILLPEIPYDIKKVAKSIKDSKKDYAVVVVAEGAMSKKEAKLDKKAFKKARAEMKTTISARVAQEIEEETGIETRSTVLGYIQRGAEPSAYDRILATQFGTAAAEFIAKKEFGILVGMKNNKIVGIPLDKVEGKVKNIPEDFDLIQTARQEGISFGD